MSKEAMKLALEALERMKRYGNTFGYRSHEQNPYEQVCEAITALREALAEQPAQRKPLTDKQILADETLRYYFGQNGGAGPVSKQGRKVVDAIEAAHNIKE